MNHKKIFGRETATYRVPYNESHASEELIRHIISWIPRFPREFVVVCIGTDRSTGDALGPLVGTLLSEKKPRHLSVYGTLHDPVHAMNLTESLDEINRKHRKPFVIAIDACLGKSSSIGHLIAGTGPIKPGAALKKSLPEVGDIHMTGVVNTGGFMDHAVLQSTRLSMVMDMAENISEVLNKLDQQLSPSFIRPAILRELSERENTI